MISSYVGENAEFERQYLAGELEVELTPQVGLGPHGNIYMRVFTLAGKSETPGAVICAGFPIPYFIYLFTLLPFSRLLLAGYSDSARFQREF